MPYINSACAIVDPDDVEPYLWRCMSEARAHGWEAAQQGLQDFSGYDRRLCMMLVLDLFKGEATVEEVGAFAVASLPCASLSPSA